MKRIITISVIILVVASIILGGAWLLSRNTAQKNGTAPLSFKEFITGKNGTATQTTKPGSIDSIFTPEGTDATVTKGAGNKPIPVATSTFTDSTSLNPSSGGVDILNPQLSPGNGRPITPGVIPGTTIDQGGTVVIVPGASTLVSSGCSDADQNITFTQQELSELRGLQNRFYKVATTLHTDADVSAEIANYDSFDVKLQKLIALNQYCAQNIGRITTGTLAEKVPTPFWHDLSTDNLLGYFSGSVRIINTILGPIDLTGYGGGFDGGDIAKSQRNLELALRLNLW